LYIDAGHARVDTCPNELGFATEPSEYEPPSKRARTHATS